MAICPDCRKLNNIVCFSPSQQPAGSPTAYANAGSLAQFAAIKLAKVCQNWGF